jgi:hypothetical protein
MNMICYQNNPDGDICFPVKGRHYLGVLEHLRSKGLHPGGKQRRMGIHEILIGDVTLPHLVQALADFKESW